MKNMIKELRLKNHLTLRQLGKELDMYDSRISQYETGKCQPNIETWQKLANYFNVSVPYLQGFININIPNNFKFNSKQDAIDCIEKIMKALEISKEDLEESIKDEKQDQRIKFKAGLTQEQLERKSSSNGMDLSK